MYLPYWFKSHIDSFWSIYVFYVNINRHGHTPVIVGNGFLDRTVVNVKLPVCHELEKLDKWFYQKNKINDCVFVASIDFNEKIIIISTLIFSSFFVCDKGRHAALKITTELCYYYTHVEVTDEYLKLILNHYGHGG